MVEARGRGVGRGRVGNEHVWRTCGRGTTEGGPQCYGPRGWNGLQVLILMQGGQPRAV